VAMGRNEPSDTVAAVVTGIAVGTMVGAAIAQFKRHPRPNIRPVPADFIKTLEELGASEDVVDTLKSRTSHRLVQAHN
jgi:hypothetical protein